MLQFFSLLLQRYSHLNWTLADQVMVSGLNFLTGVDVVSYGGQIALLFLLYRFGKLEIANAFWAIAVTSATAFLIGVLTENIRPVWTYSSQIFKQSWQFGRNLLWAGQINWAGSQGILLFGASILGASSIGGIRSAQNIVGPLNILFQAMDNIIPIQAARHYSQKQLAGLTNYLKKVSLLGGLLLALPCMAIALLSKELIELAYGEAYGVFAKLIVLQLIIAFIAFFRIQAFYFFRTIAATKEILFNTIVACTFAFVFTIIIVYKMQETGVILSLLLSEATALFFLLTRVRKYLEK